MKKLLVLASLFVAGLIPGLAAAQQAEYLGFRACTKCHDSQGETWRTSAHAKAFESLKPNAKIEAKTKAKLDPKKDYTQDKNCVGCHVTGYGEPGGFVSGASLDDMKTLVGVTCESCHGAGGKFRNLHGEASDRLKNQGETSERKQLVTAGQNFDMEKACARCHLNFEGSTKHDAKAPFTPFSPSVGSKYQFDFQKSVMTTGAGNPIHTHFKLRGVFKGDPVPAVRAKLQEDAPEPE
jgi:hypothetical protein